MSKNYYYLVSRNKNNNKYTIIPFSRNDILRKGDQYETKQHSLEEIDLYTMKYNSKEDFIKEIFIKGIIDDIDEDLFIVARKNDELKYLEIIYNNDNNNIDRLKDIATTSILKKDVFTTKIYKILDEFAYKVSYDFNYYKYVVFGNTNIYKKYINYFKNEKDLSKIYKNKYNDGGWALNSYNLIRNIVESTIRYEEDIKNNINIFESKQRTLDLNTERDNIGNSILIETDKNNAENQLFLFEDEETDKLKRSDKNDKLNQIMIFIDTLPKDIIYHTKDNNYVINNTFFENYNNEKYNKILNECLDIETKKMIYLYTQQNDFYKRHMNKKDIRDKYLENNKLKIKTKLQSDEELINKIYLFYKVFNKYLDEYIKYIQGELDGKVYRKQRY